jgi:hypothetical protein
MQISGHETRAVFEHYNIVSDGDLEEAARKLGILRQNDKGKRRLDPKERWARLVEAHREMMASPLLPRCLLPDG